VRESTKNTSHLNAVVQLCLSNVYLSASAVVIHYEEALYQMYAPLPLPLPLLYRLIKAIMLASPPSADSADGRQSRQPITCFSAVAGGGTTSKK